MLIHIFFAKPPLSESFSDQQQFNSVRNISDDSIYIRIDGTKAMQYVIIVFTVYITVQ